MRHCRIVEMSDTLCGSQGARGRDMGEGKIVFRIGFWLSQICQIRTGVACGPCPFFSLCPHAWANCASCFHSLLPLLFTHSLLPFLPPSTSSNPLPSSRPIVSPYSNTPGTTRAYKPPRPLLSPSPLPPPSAQCLIGYPPCASLLHHG